MKPDIKLALSLTLVGFVSIFFLSGCVTAPATKIFESTTTTIADILDQASFSKTDIAILREHFGRSTGNNLQAYTRTQESEINNLFPTIDNPRLTVFIYPHITGRGDPVPAYSTAFYLFTQSNLFALPGEAHQYD